MTADNNRYRLNIQAALDSISHLPMLPEVAQQLINSLNQPDLDLATLSRQIEMDQALTAKVLRIANSSFYGLPRQIETVQDAAMVLGFGALRTLALATVMVNHFSALKLPPSFNHPRFWSHSMAVGLCAELLAKRQGQFAGIAFMAGLMHDIGSLVLAAHFPEHLDACSIHKRTQHCDKLEAERAVLGITHPEIGAALATHWHFPVLVAEGIALHHQPDAATTPVPHLVHLADAIVHGELRTDVAVELSPKVSKLSWSRYGMDTATLQDILQTLDARMAAIQQILP